MEFKIIKKVQIMNLFEARQRVNNLEDILYPAAVFLEKEWLGNQRKCIDYYVEIVKTFQKYYLFNLMRTEEFTLDMIEDFKITVDVEKLQQVKRYSILNPLAALKIYGHRIQKLVRENNKIKSQLRKIQKEYSALDKDLRQTKYFKNKEKIYDLIHKRKSAIHEVCNYEETDLSNIHECIMMLFLNEQTISSQNFLGLITMQHDLVSWDGVDLPSYPERIAALPEQLDYEAFLHAVFIEKIEDDRDCIFFDVVMDHTLKLIDSNKEFGEIAKQQRESIFGPMQTYTVQFDQYGEIHSINPNKPDLQLVQ